MTSIRPALLFATVAALACAPPASSSGRSSGGRSGGSSDAPITRQQILDSKATNAYDVVSRLRPMFLRSRGQTTFGTGGGGTQEYPEVYLDGQRYGAIESLRSLTVDPIQEIRFLGGPDATIKYGTGHAAGVIEIDTK